jgi:hypothetical protein
VNCREFVDVIENHNRAFRLISRDSKYCKVVSADDWIYPECLDEIVGVAETYPSAGIIGSYSITGKEVRWCGVPLQTNCIDGQQICRLYLNGHYTFGAPSALLYRAIIVRETDPFFPGPGSSADTAACLAVLRDWDFGFVHKILSFERVHDQCISSHVATLNCFLLDRIEFLLRYGQYFLREVERKERLDTLLTEYYACLATGIVNFRGREFWEYQRARISAMGLKLSKGKITKATLAKLVELSLNLQQTVGKIRRRINSQPEQPAGFATNRLA